MNLILILPDIENISKKARPELVNQTPALLNENGYIVWSVQDTN
jgi:hypothetical protein